MDINIVIDNPSEQRLQTRCSERIKPTLLRMENTCSLEKFKDFRISKISDTIEWANGADLAPEYLYDNLQ